MRGSNITARFSNEGCGFLSDGIRLNDVYCELTFPVVRDRCCGNAVVT